MKAVFGSYLDETMKVQIVFVPWKRRLQKHGVLIEASPLFVILRHCYCKSSQFLSISCSILRILQHLTTTWVAANALSSKAFDEKAWKTSQKMHPFKWLYLGENNNWNPSQNNYIVAVSRFRTQILGLL